MAVAFVSGAVHAQAVPAPIAAPQYGHVLFEFWQDKYFSAITTLMVSQHFDRLAPHGDEGEVLRGGLLLSYGMHQEAGRIFARLIERNAPLAVRDRAWYYLGKIRWQRGVPADAEAALARIEGTLPGALEEDRALLHANVLMARGDFAGAAQRLRTLPAASAASRIARFNLGVALVRGGDSAAGSALLDEVGRGPAIDEEDRALRDRANVALGFAALQDARADDARRALERVRLAGSQSNRALLGFGWAAAAAKQPAQALVPWAELAGRAESGERDTSVLEAQLALPYAFAELGAHAQAMDGYQQAVARFDTEEAALAASIGAIRSGQLMAGLAARNPADEMGWFGQLAELPEMPHAGHLTQVLAQHEFQEAFKNWRDLHFLARNLASWRESLGAYRDLLAERQAAFARRLAPTHAGATGTRADLAEIEARRASLAAELDRVAREGDVIAFADARQDAMLQRLAGVQAHPDAAAQADKLRLLSGALAWQLAQDAPAREWAARKALRDADAGLHEARARERSLAQAQRDEPARFAAFARRIDALERQLDALIPRVAAATGEQRVAVEAIAVAELARAQQRLADYRTQARFALAQLHDRAALLGSAKESRDAPRR